MAKADRELIMQTYFHTSNEIMYWNKSANDRVDEITKQMIGAAIITIPLTGALIMNKHMNASLGVILAFALFFLLISIASGIVHMNVANKFFISYMSHNVERAKALYKSRKLTFDEAIEKANEASDPSKLPGRANAAYSIIQGWCLGIGLTLISGIIVALIFI